MFMNTVEKNINPSLALVQPRKTRPFITEILLMGRKESKQKHRKWTRIHCINKLGMFG